MPIYIREKDGNRSRKVAFYLCTSNSHALKFTNLPYYDTIQLLNIRIIPDDDAPALLLLEKNKEPKPRCMYCTLTETTGREIVKTSRINDISSSVQYKEIKIPVLTKLYTIEQDTKALKFAGYICEQCRAVYLRPEMRNNAWQTRKNVINVLEPIMDVENKRLAQNEELTHEEKETKAKDLIKKNSIIKVFESLGLFATRPGI